MIIPLLENYARHSNLISFMNTSVNENIVSREL